VRGCLACALESVQTMIGCAQRPERQQSRSSINDADRSVYFWLSEVSDTGACNAGSRCVSYLSPTRSSIIGRWCPRNQSPPPPFPSSAGEIPCISRPNGSEPPEMAVHTKWIGRRNRLLTSSEAWLGRNPALYLGIEVCSTMAKPTAAGTLCRFPGSSRIYSEVLS
jgi:hypothetical protein